MLFLWESLRKKILIRIFLGYKITVRNETKVNVAVNGRHLDTLILPCVRSFFLILDDLQGSNHLGQ